MTCTDQKSGNGTPTIKTDEQSDDECKICGAKLVAFHITPACDDTIIQCQNGCIYANNNPQMKLDLEQIFGEL